VIKLIAKALLLALTIAYPFLVYWGINTHLQTGLLALLCCVLVLRVCLAKSAQDRFLILGCVVVIALIILASNAQVGIKLYPVVVNLSLLTVFISSLFSSMPMVERLARLREPHLCERAVGYTRKVTKVWCVFFAVNASVSLATVVYGNDAVWLWYNGVIAYLLIAALFSIEWLVRRRVKASSAS